MRGNCLLDRSQMQPCIENTMFCNPHQHMLPHNYCACVWYYAINHIGMYCTDLLKPGSQFRITIENYAKSPFKIESS